MAKKKLWSVWKWVAIWIDVTKDTGFISFGTGSWAFFHCRRWNLIVGHAGTVPLISRISSMVGGSVKKLSPKAWIHSAVNVLHLKTILGNPMPSEFTHKYAHIQLYAKEYTNTHIYIYTPWYILFVQYVWIVLFCILSNKKPKPKRVHYDNGRNRSKKSKLNVDITFLSEGRRTPKDRVTSHSKILQRLFMCAKILSMWHSALL